jgi:hypothetical protein
MESGRGRGLGRGRGSGIDRAASAAAAAANTNENPPSAVTAAQSVLQHDIFAPPTPATMASAGRGSSRAGDFFARGPSRAPATARFRPKNVRRDEASREALARQEAEKEEAKKAAEDRQRTRGRFRSRRSRGGVMGRGRGSLPSYKGAGAGWGEFMVGAPTQTWPASVALTECALTPSRLQGKAKVGRHHRPRRGRRQRPLKTEDQRRPLPPARRARRRRCGRGGCRLAHGHR